MLNLYIYSQKKIKIMGDKLSQILEHATTQGYRSNILKPLLGIIIILFLATIAFAYLNKEILYYTTFVMAGIIFIAFIVSFFYCLFKNPDLLRSEKYNLEKTAIEKVSISGDSLNTGKVLPPVMDYVMVGSIKNNNSTEIE